ncbi:hypothetical protein BDZ45DRAFT_284616 [Acephala macrosclerotiorum]|nr:hypothetical protein BDZ45DRAFT_284616 [Acephala macrosclerotiorum]
MPSGFTNELMESLKPFGHNPRYSRIETEHEESLQWVCSEDPEGPNFVKWLKTEESLMWISGKPGAGKSTLMKYIHDRDDTLPIMRSSVHGRLEFISYFLHDLGSPTERTFLGLLHGLLSQVLTLLPELAPTIHQRFRKLRIRYSTSSQEAPIWSEVELQAAFRDIIKNQTVEATVLCMIDALDECETKQLHPLLRFITNLATHPQKGGLTFKVICSNRRENAIELAFTKFPSFRIENFTSKDIESFIISRLAEVTDNLYPDEKADRVIAEVVEGAVIKAEGVFIWAILVADELILAIEAGQILKLYQTLKDLPSDLEELYANIIEKIPLEGGSTRDPIICSEWYSPCNRSKMS